MLRGLGSVFSFLTIIPVGNTDLRTAAEHMYLFPLVGLALGLLFGSIGFGLSMFLDSLIVGLVVVALIAVITGIHHTDGLADFADGLMAGGSREHKLAAMKDLSTGSAGTMTIILYVVGLIVALSMTEGYDLFLAILLAEIVAKFSMVFMATTSTSASPGSGSVFVSLKNYKKLLIAAAILLIPIFVLVGPVGLMMFGVGITVTMFMSVLSARSFGGITGDVLGATNEVTRLTSIMVFVVI